LSLKGFPKGKNKPNKKRIIMHGMMMKKVRMDTADGRLLPMLLNAVWIAIMNMNMVIRVIIIYNDSRKL
jgi:hypothetical protein